MAQPMIRHTSLAEAAATFVDALHHVYADISIQPIAPYEDEDLTLQITIPTTLSRDQVLGTCHRECLKIEDDYEVFLLPVVVYGH
jgi:hypothetical protein